MKERGRGMDQHDGYAYDETFLPQSALGALAEQLPTPFYLYHEQGIRESVRRLKQAFGWCEGFRQYFPIHVLPLPAVLQILREEGCGIRCRTLRDLRLARRCGFRAGRILYGPMVPQADALAEALRLGAPVSLDNPAAVEICLRQRNLPQTVSLCYNPGGKFLVDRMAAARPERSKRGMTEPQLLAQAKRLLHAGVRRLGLEADLTVQTLECGYYAAVLRMLCQLAGRLREHGVGISFFNLGDGPGLGFLPEEQNADLAAWGARARLEMDAVQPPVPVWTAAGRILTGPNGIFVSRVLCRKQMDRNFIILDADAEAFPRMLQGAYHHISLLGKTQRAGRLYCDVVGCMPDSQYRFGEHRLLPPAEAGDCCILHNAGAGAALQQQCGAYLYAADGTVRPAGDVRKEYGKTSEWKE